MKMFQIIMLGLCLAGLTACGPGTNEVQGDPETLTFSVQGMTCENCVKFLTTDLAGRPGAVSVSVSLEDEQAVVVCNPALFNLAEVALDLQKKGYTLTRK